MNQPNGIGTLSETSLHAGLKAWLAQPGDTLEKLVDGYVIDVVRGEQLIEVQTGNFGGMKAKLLALLPHHPIWLVHPIPQEKWIVRLNSDRERLSRRKSPKRGRLEDVFAQLIRIPQLITHPNLRVEVLLTQQEEVWLDDGQGSWRRKGWSKHDHRLLAVVERRLFAGISDYLALLPPSLPTPFTNRDLAKALLCPVPLAQKMSYTLKQAGGLEIAGKQGKSNLYRVNV